MDGLGVSMCQTIKLTGWKLLIFNIADDTLIFCDVEEIQLKYLWVILILFEAIYELHINWRKSQTFQLMWCQTYNIWQPYWEGKLVLSQLSILGCFWEVKANQETVGLESWKGVRKKLSRWKLHYISLGSRLALINSVLDALPTYLMPLSLYLQV